MTSHRRTRRCSSPARSLAYAIVVAAVALCAATPLHAADDVTLTKTVEVEGISEYQMSNGLKVLLFPDPTKATVTVNVTYRVGSRHEGRGEAGMAHLLEHMVFKGTPTYPTIWGALQDHGASFNGTTWVDRTNYFEILPASEENLDFVLHMEADRMVNSLISADELAKEMTVVRNEFELGENNPVGILMERIMSAAFLWHNYGKSTIGNRSDIERVPAESLKEFYKTYYQPDNATLVVAGKFDPDWTLEKIKEHFGAIPRPSRELQATYTEEPPQDGARSVTLRRAGSLSATGVVYHIPAGSHPDYPPFAILAEILTDRPAGRLYKELVETDKATTVFPRVAAWKEPGVLGLMARVRLDQDVELAQKTMVDVVENLAGSVNSEEVERAKAKLLKNIHLGLTDSTRIGIQLSEWEALGDWRMMFVHRDRIKAVTADDVNRVAKDYLIESNRTAGLFIPTDSEPTRAHIPPTPDVEEFVRDYKGTEKIDRGEAFETTATNIERRTRRTKLENGLQLALLSKKTRGNVVHGSLVLRFGTEDSIKDHRTALGLIPALMMRGTTERDHQGIRDELNRIETQLNLGGSSNAVFVSLETTRENLPAAVDLMAEILRQPSLPEEEFEVIRKERVSRLEENKSNPQALAFNQLQRALNPFPKDSMFYVKTFSEELEAIQALRFTELRPLYSRFYGTSHALGAFVGDFDEEELIALLQEKLGDWEAPEEYARIAYPYVPIEASDSTIDTPDKTAAMVVRGTTLKLRDDDPLYPALTFANFVFGQSPKSRLMNSLRHEGGLSYGAGSMLQADDQDEYGALMAFAMCAPQNAAKAQKTMQAEFHRLVEEGLSAQDVEEFKVGFTEQWKTQLGNDRFIVQQLRSDLDTKRSFEFHQRLVDAVAELEREEIHQAIRTFIAESNFVDLKAGDVAKFEGED